MSSKANDQTPCYDFLRIGSLGFLCIIEVGKNESATVGPLEHWTTCKSSPQPRENAEKSKNRQHRVYPEPLQHTSFEADPIRVSTSEVYCRKQECKQ